MAEVIRVLIAEDEEPLRAAIADLVASEAELEVVAAVASAEEAIAAAAELTPDVALVDVRMPGGGAAAARGIGERSPKTRIVALSAYEDQATVVEMLRAGAVGYLVKGIAAVEVVEAIRRAARGQASISIDVITRAIEDLAGDMDERREAEEVLRRSGEQQFGALLQSAPDAVIIADADGRIVLVNKQTEELFGYEADELLGKPVEMFLPERFHERHVGHRGGYAANPETRPMGAGLELAGRRKDGTEFPVDISLSAIETESGRLMTAFVRDITERRAVEIAMRQLPPIVESSDDAIIGKDLNGSILSWNRAAERIYGYTADEVIGRSVSILVPPGQSDELAGILNRLKRREEIDELESQRLRKDGTVIDVSLKFSAIRDAGGA